MQVGGRSLGKRVEGLGSHTFKFTARTTQPEDCLESCISANAWRTSSLCNRLPIGSQNLTQFLITAVTVTSPVSSLSSHLRSQVPSPIPRILYRPRLSRRMFQSVSVSPYFSNSSLKRFQFCFECRGQPQSPLPSDFQERRSVRQRCLPRAISGERRKSSEHLRNIFLAKQREFVEGNLGHAEMGWPNCSVLRLSTTLFQQSCHGKSAEVRAQRSSGWDCGHHAYCRAYRKIPRWR